MDIPIIYTKFHQPDLLLKHVYRPHLIQHLNSGLDVGRQITLISAPAGFGKTSCASEWIASINKPVTWLSLDPLDDDPGRFFTYLIAALQRINVNIGIEIEAVIKSGQIPPNELICSTLINDILKTKHQFLIVLDDFHFIQDSIIYEFIEQFIINIPLLLHLVIITREDPGLPMARLRANNKITEVRAKDLRFSSEDIKIFFNKIMGLSLSHKDLTLIEKKTEGWIAGLQLTGLSIKDLVNPSEFIAALGGSHRFILSYLTEQVINHQSSEVRAFLLQTSILDKFNSDLCNAITQRSNGREMLDRLYNANLFLIPLDNECQWYRYHHLFSDLLQSLLQREKIEKRNELHKRASRWYTHNNMTSQAIHHSLIAGDYKYGMSLLESHAMSLIMHGYAKTVNNWVQSLPEEWYKKSTRIKLAFAWVCLIRGAYPQIAQYIDKLEKPIAAEDNPALRAELLVMKSLLLYMRNEFSASMEKASEALEITPANDDHVRSLAYYAQASVHQSRNDFTQAEIIFKKSIQYSRKSVTLFTELMSTISLAAMAIERGKLHQAYELVSRTIKRLENTDEMPPISAYVYLALGDIYYQWFQAKKGQELAQHALRLSKLGGFNSGVIFCHLLLARFFQIENNPKTALIEVHQAEDLLPQEGPEYIRQEITAQQINIYLNLNRLDAAVSLLEEYGFSFGGQFSFPALSQEEFCTFSLGRLYNCSLRTLLRQDFDQNNFLAGLELSNCLIESLSLSQQFLVQVETILLRAQIHAKLGNLLASDADIISALEKGKAEGLISIFIEQGESILQAINGLADNHKLKNIDHNYIDAIIDAFPKKVLIESRQNSLIDHLTDRERDVLCLMAEGFSYNEIGKNLFISVNTVRYHVKAIYGKFNVNNRTQALEKARKLNMI